MLLSDMNGDGVVDVFDIDLFVAALTGSESQAWTYGYNAENQLVSAFPGVTPHTGSTRQVYTYDYAGRRVQQATETYTSGAWNTASPTDVERYVHDGWKIVMTLDGDSSNTPLAKYTWGLDLSGQNGYGLWGVGGAPAGLSAAGGIGGLLAVHQAQTGGGAAGGGLDAGDFIFFYDANGNVSEVFDLVNADAADLGEAIAAHYEYSPFGQVVAQAGGYAGHNPFRFSTKPFDNVTGLGDWGRRHYDPRLGRWLTRDPLGYLDGVNLYGYVGNGALLYVDRLGLDSVAVYDGDDNSAWAKGDDFKRAADDYDWYIDIKDLQDVYDSLKYLTAFEIEVDELHIFDHGAPGAQEVGDLIIDPLNPHKNDGNLLEKIGALMEPDAMIWLHGCSTGKYTKEMPSGIFAADTTEYLQAIADKSRHAVITYDTDTIIRGAGQWFRRSWAGLFGNGLDHYNAEGWKEVYAYPKNPIIVKIEENNDKSPSHSGTYLFDNATGMGGGCNHPYD